MTTLAIEATGLRKTYGDVTALAGLDLAVPEGTVLGLLGPNGAGKTTCVRILTTLLTADGGQARVGGHDVAADPQKVRAVIGLSGQFAAVDEYLTGFENLDMVGRLYRMGAKAARVRAHELLAQFDLVDAADRTVKTFSGGMRRRLDLAAALVAKPRILFLDEPTTGLDPRSRIGMWDVLEELVHSGTTVLLTTQYLEEADRLADEIVVIDHGKGIAQGTADELKSQIGGERLEVTVTRGDDGEKARALLDGLGTGTPTYDPVATRVSLPVTGGATVLLEAIRQLDGAGVEIADVSVRRPTLDDVFLTLTGHAAEDVVENGDGTPAKRRRKEKSA